MAEAKLSIGGRNFRVACEDGQEGYLQSAAGLLDQHAKIVLEANESIAENQLLLMAGLMSADQAKATDRENLDLKSHHKDLETRITRLEARAAEALALAESEHKNQLDDLKTRLADAQKEINQNRTELDKIKSNNAQSANPSPDKELQTRLSALEAENRKLQDSNARLQDQLEASQNDLKIAQNGSKVETDAEAIAEDQNKSSSNTDSELWNDLINGLERLAKD